MKPIILFDVNVGSENMGDAIIMHYCNMHLRSIFPNDFFLSIPTHDSIGERFKTAYLNAKLKVVCGTNLISATMNDKTCMQWFLDAKDRRLLRDVILMGVGWQSYNEKINRYSRQLLHSILSKENYLLSVRDNYTKERLNSMGFANVVNTGCPTMWNLTSQFCEEINTKKTSDVVTTITNYNRDYLQDKYMLDVLKRKYQTVYIWIQSYYDIAYLQEICNVDEYKLIPPSMEKYTEILQTGIDYVGTRLHAGIHALNNKCRTIIVSVDNRAKEISRDTKLFVIEREDLQEKLEKAIVDDLKCEIVIPTEEIKQWKEQFVRKTD